MIYKKNIKLYNFILGQFKLFIRLINKIIIFFLRRKKIPREINYFLVPNEAVRFITDDILVEAGDIIENKISIFCDKYQFKNKLPWHSDWEVNYIWKAGKFFTKYDQENYHNNSDVKYPRELSRCHHFLILGQAYMKTGEKKYYIKFKKTVIDWIEENPFMHSINWGCPQDVSIRAVNWLWAISFFRNEIFNDQKFLKLINKSLYEHGFFIYTNPEKNYYNNHNHYLGDLVGQIHLGLYFKNDKYGKNWLSWGIQELFREIRYQILPSGPSYERSINYHRLVTEFILYTIIILKNNNFEIPQDIMYRLEKMLEFVMYYTKPDGQAPIIGDQDSARLLPFSLTKHIDHRYLLCIGAILFNRSDFKKIAGQFYPEAEIMLGKGSFDKFNTIETYEKDITSRSLPDAGFYIIRHKNNYMYINNSGKSKNPELGGGTHTHSDLLSFELFIGDKSFIVDPGTYKYSSDADARMLFRSTPMHNTITVDDVSQNELKREVLWDFERNAIPKSTLWKETEDKVVFEGEHNGYQRLSDPVIHQRRIEYDKQLREFKITDNIIGSGMHKIELNLHFDVNVPIDIENNKLITKCSEGTNIEISFVSKQQFKTRIYESWISKAYSSREKAKAFCLQVETECPYKFITKIKRIDYETSF